MKATLAGYVLTEEESGIIRVYRSETKEEFTLENKEDGSLEGQCWGLCHSLIRFNPVFNANMKKVLNNSMLTGAKEVLGSMRNLIDQMDAEVQERFQ